MKPGVGIVASSIAPPGSGGTVVLVEPFDNLTAWTLGSGGSIQAGGKVGNYFRLSTTSSRGYPIPSLNQSADFDVEFWWRSNNVTTTTLTILTVRSTVTEMTLSVNNSRQFGIHQGTGSPILGTSAALANVNIWYRLRWIGHMANSPNGTSRLDLDGTTVITVTSAKTYATTALAQSIYTSSLGGLDHDYDELVLRTG